MTEHRSPLQRLALALSATIGLAACSRYAPPPKPATPAAAMQAPGAMEPSPTDLEGQIAALGSAETRLNEALGRGDDAPGGGAEAQDTKPVGAPRKGDKTAADAPEEKKNDAEQLNQGDACSTACSALSSMERATVHLCGLAGESDRRCEEARAKVQAATSRVRASCPVCAAR